MLYVISYDISIDKRRNKLAKLLEGAGQRVQYSVFECDLTTTQYRKIETRINKLIRPTEGDSVRIYTVCHDCRQQTRLIGKGPALETSPDIYIF